LVALKLSHIELNSDKEMEGRFVQEARALSLLHHAHIVTVYQLAISNSGIPYLVMELVNGHSLRDLIITEGALPPKRALAIIKQACEALAYAHENGVVHRDVKPENIVLLPAPHPDFVKILDFGLAKFVYSGEQLQKLTQTGLLIGTANYMSPEQCLGQAADHRSDVYSLTACLYELLSGEAPYSADNAMGVLYKHLNDPLPSLEPDTIKEFHPSLQKIIDRGMAKDADERFQTMADLQLAIDEAAELLGTKVDLRKGRQAAGKRELALIGGIALSVLLLFACMLSARNVSSNKDQNVLKKNSGAYKARSSASFVSQLRRIKETLENDSLTVKLTPDDWRKSDNALDQILANSSKNKALSCVARLYKFQVQTFLGASSAAKEANLKMCLSLCKTDDGADTIEAAEVYYCLASLYYQLERFDDAELAIRKAFDLRSAFEVEDNKVPCLDVPQGLGIQRRARTSTAVCLLYGDIMQAKGKFNEALKWYDLSLQRSSAEPHWNRLMYFRKADVLIRLGRRADARDLIQQYESQLYDFVLESSEATSQKMAGTASKTLGLGFGVGSAEIDNGIDALGNVGDFAVEIKEVDLAKRAYEMQISLSQKLGLDNRFSKGAVSHLEELKKGGKN
ncbi:MAG: serine/threonine protein kinase, partial [Candidatus Obscuribacterales bacterium]|nr:serine/threonine protein kinase [Candidatus Obscuribacterales bacterium]